MLLETLLERLVCSRQIFQVPSRHHSPISSAPHSAATIDIEALVIDAEIVHTSEYGSRRRFNVPTGAVSVSVFPWRTFVVCGDTAE